MLLERYRSWVLAGIAALVVSVAAVAFATTQSRAGGPDEATVAGVDEDAGEVEAAPGTLDDGADLLPLAGTTLDQAIAAARGAAEGAIGEADLEYYDGVLVYNVDVGPSDVKVDAQTAEVIAVTADD